MNDHLALKRKMVIYQLLPRLFGNECKSPALNGEKAKNGCGTFNSISDEAIQSIKNLGITHIWLTGILRHATQTDYPKYNLPASHPATVKGKAGSPYAISDFFDLDPDLVENPANRFEEFSLCVDRIRNSGLGVIIDFIPNHTARQYHSEEALKSGHDLGKNDFDFELFHPNNNFYYLPDQPLKLPVEVADEKGNLFEENPAKATGNDCFSANPSITDWYETTKLNYGIDYHSGRFYFDPIPDTWKYMLKVLTFWAEKKIDGFRCDMVEMVPVEFWAWAILQVKNKFPDLFFLGEVYNPALYYAYLNEGKFDLLYDKVEMYDQVRALVEQKGNADMLTQVWQKQEGFGHRMLRFLENHDEQRIASLQVGKEGKKTLSAMAATAFYGQGPVMIYFGQELGETADGEAGFSGDDGKTTIFDYWTIPCIQRWNNKGKWNEIGLTENERSLRNRYSQILNFAQQNPAIVRGQFYDLQYANQYNGHYKNQLNYTFLRYTWEEKLLVTCSFTSEDQWNRIIIPVEAWQTAGLDPNGHFRFTDAFDQSDSIDCFAKACYMADGGTAGFSVKMNAFEFKVWKIEPTD